MGRWRPRFAATSARHATWNPDEKSHADRPPTHLDRVHPSPPAVFSDTIFCRVIAFDPPTRRG